MNNRLEPTAEAKQLHRDAEPLFHQFRAIEQRVEDLRQTRSGKIRILATPPLGNSVVPKVLKRFLARRPNVRVFFDVRRMEGVVESIETGVADLGLVLGLENHPVLEVLPVRRGRMVCVMPRGHPLADLDIVTPLDLRGFPLIALEVDSNLGTLVRQGFRWAGEVFSSSVEVRYCNTACILARSGVGVAIVDAFTAGSSQQEDLVVRPFEPALWFTAAALRAKGRDSRLARAFLAELRAVMLTQESPIECSNAALPDNSGQTEQGLLHRDV